MLMDTQQVRKEIAVFLRKVGTKFYVVCCLLVTNTLVVLLSNK